METRGRFKVSQPTHQEGSLQNGVTAVNSTGATAGRLDVINQPAGCLLPYSDIPGIPEIPKIHVRGATPPVHLPTVRPNYLAQNLHKSTARHCSSTEGPRYQDISLPRRCPTSGSKQRDPAHPQKGGAGNLTTARLASQLGEEPVAANARDHLPGSRARHMPEHHIATSRKGARGHEKSSSTLVPPDNVRKKLPKVGRDYDVHDPNGEGGAMECPLLPTWLPETVVNTEPLPNHPAQTGYARKPTVVAVTGKPAELPFAPANGVGTNSDRRQRTRLGSPLSGGDGTGVVAIPGARRRLQRLRDEGSLPGHEGLCSQDQRESGDAQDGQHNSSGVCEAPRGHPQQISPERGRTTDAMGTGKLGPPLGSICARSLQPAGRLPFKIPTGQQRVGTPSSSIPSPDALGLCAAGGHVRIRTEQEGEGVPLQRSLSPSEGCGCPDGSVGVCHGVRLPTSPANREVPQEAADGEAHGPSIDPMVAAPPVVPTLTPTQHQKPNAFTCTRRPTSARPSTAPSAGQVSPSGLDLERERLRGLGCSTAVVNTLLCSRKKSTYATYNRVWAQFCEFMTTRGLRPGDPQLSDLLEFLQRGLDLGLSLSTLKGHVSAISAFTGRHWAAEELIIRFFRAVIRLKPPRTLLFPKWDLPLVLDFLNAEEPPIVPGNALWNLTLKTAFLVAIASASRVSELAALGAKEPFTTFFEDRAILVPIKGFLPKVTTQFHLRKEVVLPIMAAEGCGVANHLVVYRTLKYYISATADLRTTERLFVSPAGPNRGKSASGRTIASWLVKVITAAYKGRGLSVPRGITAHSTRGMAASWAARGGMSPEEICKAAAWSSPHTFMAHYCLEPAALGATNFGLTVLTAASVNN